MRSLRACSRRPLQEANDLNRDARPSHVEQGQALKQKRVADTTLALRSRYQAPATALQDQTADIRNASRGSADVHASGASGQDGAGDAPAPPGTTDGRLECPKGKGCTSGTTRHSRPEPSGFHSRPGLAYGLACTRNCRQTAEFGTTDVDNRFVARACHAHGCLTPLVCNCRVRERTTDLSSGWEVVVTWMTSL
jgi:hypothetical protein